MTNDFILGIVCGSLLTTFIRMIIDFIMPEDRDEEIDEMIEGYKENGKWE